MTVYKLLKRPFFGRYMVKWRNPLPESEINDWQRITTTSKSEGEIRGLFARSLTGEEKGTIVLGHPMGKEAKGYFLKNGYVDILRNNGYNVVVFDMNGFGESTHGNFSYYEDILAIGHKAQNLTPNIPIGYLGISLGGQWAVIAFTENAHPYKFAVIESAATTLDEFWKNYPFAYGILQILNIFLPRYRKKVNMLNRASELKGLKSILFIYSEADHLTPPSMGRRYSANCNIPSKLLVLENAKHASAMKSVDKEKYIQSIIEYFDGMIR